MPTKQMKIHAQLPTFSNQNEEVKSLINFFMKNASVFFRGEYDANNKLESYTGVVRFNNRALEDAYDADYTPYELVIPYHSYFQADSDPEFPTFPTLPVDDVSSFSSTLPFVNNTKIPVLDGVLDTSMSSLTSVKTAMNLYSGTYDDDDQDKDHDGYTNDYIPYAQFEETNTITLPVRLIPKVGNDVNTDIKLKPKQLALHHPNSDGLYLQKIPIENILDENGDPIAEGFVYDFQLKTDPFTIKYPNPSGEGDPYLYKSVYYKVGICMLDPNEDIDTVISALKESALYMEYTSIGSSGAYVSFSVKDISHGSSNTYNFNPSTVFIEQHIGTGNLNGVATKLLVPIQTSGNNVAFVYLEMFNLTDDTSVTEVFDDLDFGINNLNSGEGVYLRMVDVDTIINSNPGQIDPGLLVF